MAKAKRNSAEIRGWLARRRILIVTIQKAVGHKNNKTVWATIEGKEHNRQVLSWLRNAGCPTKYLALPKDMQTRRAA